MAEGSEASSWAETVATALPAFTDRIAFADAQDHIESGGKRRLGLGPDIRVRLALRARVRCGRLW
jgi:hypothetical protein